MSERTFTPGFRFKDGKLYIFGEQEAILATTWPELTAVKKTTASTRWCPFWPTFRLIHPYRRLASAKARSASAQEQLTFNLELRVQLDLAEQRKRAFDSYRFSFPKEIANALERFQSEQWSILHLLKADPEAISLVSTDPALAYLLAHQFIQDCRLPREWPRFSGIKQRILAHRLGFPGTEGAVNILKKVPAESVSTKRLARLRAALDDPETQKTLSHLRVVNAGVIELVGDGHLRELCTPCLLQQVSACLPEKYRADTAELLHQLLAVKQTLVPERKLQFQSLDQLRRVHDELTVEYCRRAPADFKDWTFPRPPLPGVPNCIVPILTPLELVKEGERQSNCVASYAKRVCDGEVFIYRLLHPERATLSLVNNEDGRWRLGELKTARNAPVQSGTVRIVQSWLLQHTTFG